MFDTLGDSINSSLHKSSKVMKKISVGLTTNISKSYSANSSSNSKSYHFQSDSKIREIIHYINENKPKLQDFQFLILLSDKYFIKKLGILPPKKYYIKNIILPGKLIIEKYSDWNCINKYSFESNPIPDQIYVKLPKEKVYVQYTDYEYKLLESRFNEFYDILAVIGARYIKMSKVIKNVKNNEQTVGIGVDMDLGMKTSCENTTIENKVSLKNEQDTAVFLTQEMNFNNDKDPNLYKLIHNNYYYLPNQIDLQSLIIRRIENNQTKDKYTYIHNQNSLLSTKVLTRLNKFNVGLNVDIDVTLKQISNFKIEYEIYFNDIKNTNMNNNLAIQEDETPWYVQIVNNFLKKFN